MANSLARLHLVAALAVSLAACGDPRMLIPPADDAAAPEADLAKAPPPDLARPADLATPCGPCAPPTPVCDVPNKKCVACLVDDNCPDQFICVNKACVPGCSPNHANCGDAGSCDVDMKLCHGCLADADCKDGRAPFCDLVSGRCGACTPQNDRCPAGTYCGMSNGAPACVSGCKTDAECQFADGGTGSSACCAHRCVDTRTSPAHCGACGKDCMGSACCAGACIDTQADVQNCGACGKVCPSMNNVPTCMNGACGAGPCAKGFADCNMNPNDGCETATSSDTRNCGACGQVCNLGNAQSICIGGTCQIGGCNVGFRNCNGDASDGCEVATGTDPKNCGQCGQSCAQLPNAAASCMNGGCVIGACTPGFGNCNKMDIDGCEAPLSADPQNCGACGMVCPAPPNTVVTCVNQVCGTGACVPGFADCNNNKADGCEANLPADPKNCGACGNACPAVPNGAAGCKGSMCGVGACNAGFGDCNAVVADGCEVNTNTDLNNCGACGNKCNQGWSCQAGKCVSPGVTYQQAFTAGVVPVAQCAAWTAFRGSIQAGQTYTTITMKGTNDMVGRTCNGAGANTLCQALRQGIAANVVCNGFTWIVGSVNGCGGDQELAADGSTCSCNATYTVRPCINNTNWGGVNTATCNGPSQTLIVTCG